MNTPSGQQPYNKGVRKAESKIARAVLDGQATAYSQGCNETGRLHGRHQIYLAKKSVLHANTTAIAELQIVLTQQFNISAMKESS